ncbi:hypothetical protein ACFWTE_02745 [Nocardiopsis sp. NPDC058631]|uniref:hypothetical protein n=1 Tax=Nocardiopsis sp. NPDC058631 TaxID=3346566 RepID=UPI003664127B
MPSLWITDALKAGLLPSTRAHAVAAIIADAVDADGRWCFLYLDTIAERSGGTVGVSTVKRAIDDLVGAGLVRRLDPLRARLFFYDDIAAGRRWPDRLPPVLELLIPASAYTAQALEEVNQVRRELGEEPLTAASRPYPSVGTTVHTDRNDRSERPTDLSPVDPSPIHGSVRGSDTTGRVAARAYARGVRPLPLPVTGPAPVPDPAPPPRSVPAPASGGFARRLLERIPDAALRRPGPDRQALARAVDRLAGQGLPTADLTALLEGAEALRSPFPALMRRLGSVQDARGFLDGRLGAGVRRGGGGAAAPPTGVGVPAPRRPDEGDAFARPPAFAVGPDGAAPRTCPDHPGVRNVPGGTCRVCGAPCRSVPGEILHPPSGPGAPAPAPWAPSQGAAGLGGGGGPGRAGGPLVASPREDPGSAGTAEETDPALLALMRASLTRAHPPSLRPPVPTGRAPTPSARESADSVRRHLSRLRSRATG